MNWREQEDVFDQIEEAAERGYVNGQKNVKGDIRALLVRLRSGNISKESFITRVDELTQ